MIKFSFQKITLITFLINPTRFSFLSYLCFPYKIQKLKNLHRCKILFINQTKVTFHFNMVPTMIPFSSSHALDEVHPDYGFANAPSAPVLVSHSLFTPIPLRSTCSIFSSFIQLSYPILSAKQLSQMSLQGFFVNVAKTNMARTIGGAMSTEQAVAQELFGPIQRFFIVIVIGVVVAESQKSHHIWQLNISVELKAHLSDFSCILVFVYCCFQLNSLTFQLIF